MGDFRLFREGGKAAITPRHGPRRRGSIRLFDVTAARNRAAIRPWFRRSLYSGRAVILRYPFGNRK